MQLKSFLLQLGEKDILGYEKDGLKVGDVRGVISVAVPVQ